MAYDSIPSSVSDVLMHGKDSDRTERIMLPFTRYKNVFSGPTVVTENLETKGAPFHILETETEILDETEIRKLCGRII